MVTELSVTDLASRLEKGEHLVLIDVRESHELLYGQIATSTHIPLNDLNLELDSLNPNQATVFICRSGGRSYQAATLATEHGFTSTYNLTGGMNQWATTIDPTMDVY
ncbi:MAG: rhodanese-like domain-containing protein [Candidatus Marinamargulisbacteria bacterium]|jgi:rhodanese-related sulfurtransferase|nr:rhodanese-like domain-containing protein [Candidatus Marinamargulisbacteria bacterium]